MSAQFLRTRDGKTIASQAEELFTSTFGTEPEGVWAAPGRVNLIGEHVDYAGGICLPFALTQLTAAAMSRRDDDVVKVVSIMPGGDTPSEFEISLSEVGPKNPDNWAGYAVGSIWAGRESKTIPGDCGFNIALVSDVPLGAGLSSSAALECSVALGAYELCSGEAVTDEVRTALVPACIRAENEVVGASTGGLDQRISLMGHEGHALEIDYKDDSIHQIPADFASHGLAILVINTNAPHSLADGQYASRRGVIDAVSDAFGTTLRNVDGAVDKAGEWAAEHVPDGEDKDEWVDVVRRRVRHVVTEIDRTATAVEQLKNADFEAFGVSMGASHASLRDDYEVTCPELDTAVDAAKAAGAIGARMTGGGFGGSAIALIRSDAVEKTAEAVAQAAHDAGLVEPEFLVAVPSAGARRLK